MNFLRRLFHKHQHDFEHIGCSYSCPKKLDGYDIRSLQMCGMSKNVMEKMVHGVTTYIWKCSDPACSATIVEVLLGVPMVDEVEAMSGRSVLRQLGHAKPSRS